MCPAAPSTTIPSGSCRPSLTMVFKSEPSGLTDSTRPSLRSRKKRRPELSFVASLVAFDLELVEGIGIHSFLSHSSDLEVQSTLLTETFIDNSAPTSSRLTTGRH